MPQRAPNKPKASSFRRKKGDDSDDIFEVFDEQGQDPPPLEPSATISKSEALIIAIDLMRNPARDTFKKLKESVFLPSDEQIKKNSYFKNELGENIIHVASKNGEYKALANIIKALKQQRLQLSSSWTGQEKNRSLNLFTAFASNDEETIKKLILENTNIKNSHNEFRETPLHLACEKGFERLVEILLKKNCNVNAIDSLLETPLHKASKEGHIETTSILLKNPNINIDFQNTSQETALHIACKNNFENLAQLLIFNNANINLKDEDNQTAFHIACEVGSHRIAKSLLEKGAKINEAGGKQELTPLHVAVKNGHYDIAKLLLENGAEVDCRGQFGQTPLHIAVKNGHYDIAKLLLENGADIDAKNQFGFTALHNAVKSSNISVDMVKLLLENGADINMKDSSNKTAFDIAEEKFQGSNPNLALKEIKLIFEKIQEIEASSILKALLLESSRVKKPQNLRALSIDQLTQSDKYQSPRVD